MAKQTKKSSFPKLFPIVIIVVLEPWWLCIKWWADTQAWWQEEQSDNCLRHFLQDYFFPKQFMNWKKLGNFQSAITSNVYCFSALGPPRSGSSDSMWKQCWWNIIWQMSCKVTVRTLNNSVSHLCLLASWRRACSTWGANNATNWLVPRSSAKCQAKSTKINKGDLRVFCS